MYISKVFTLLVVVVNVSAAPLFPSVTVSMDHFEVLRMRASETVSKNLLVLLLLATEGILGPRPNPISEPYRTSVLTQ
jgi:small neutral amino acid transporter SnatA (MarC family)